MTPVLSKTWWLLALCGLFDAAHAILNLLMLNPDSTLTLRTFGLPGAVRDMGMLALVAGACAFAAGVWSRGRDNSWLFSVHGLALAAFGAIGISPWVRGPLSFRPVSLLFIVMALSIGVYAFAIARDQGDGGKRVATLAGIVSVAFAFSFLAVGFKWLSLPPGLFWIWMSAYFGLCAMFMLWLAYSGYIQRVAIQGQRLQPLPRHAH